MAIKVIYFGVCGKALKDHMLSGFNAVLMLTTGERYISTSGLIQAVVSSSYWPTTTPVTSSARFFTTVTWHLLAAAATDERSRPTINDLTTRTGTRSVKVLL